MDLNDYGVELTCPTCHRNFMVSIGALTDNPRVACTGCKQPIQVPQAEIDAALAALQDGERPAG